MGVITDPIGDLLTRIRNANLVFHDHVDIPSSKLKEAILRILKREGYIQDYKYIDTKPQPILRVYLRYGGKVRAIIGLERISKPGRRVYVNKRNIPKIKGGLGCAIISTSKGVLSDSECRALGIGGEVLCYIW